MRDFLVEIHTEELPPKALKRLGESFRLEIEKGLKNANLTFKHADFFATPRRLAVLVHDLSEKQPDAAIERRGPLLSTAFDQGKPTKACIGFANSLGVEPEQLITIKNAQGEWVGFKQTVEGKSVETCLPDIVNQALANLPISKRMRWNEGHIQFIRPVHSVILLYGNNVIPAEILGVRADRKTRGHRFLSEGWLSITAPLDYEKILKGAYVIANFEEREKKILEDAEKISAEKGTVKTLENLVEFKNLLEEVTGLVEWPVALLGQFDESFLENVPAEALISAMIDHQRYFPIFKSNRNNENEYNSLLPYFVTISNIESKEPKHVIHGNERVLRARLADAAFFYETDQKVKLTDRVELLKHILFQNKLGTLYDKTERIASLSSKIAKDLNVNASEAENAARLSKADLSTQLVGEFPELQGIAGYYYAQSEALPNDICLALREQYFPKFSGDRLPKGGIGRILAIADRLDTLVGMFGINLLPTGDKDPLGLRRAALGILRILIEEKINLDLYECIRMAEQKYTNKNKLENKNTVQDVFQFMMERLKHYYQEKNIAPQIFASVVSLNLTDPYDIHLRIEAVCKFRELKEAAALASANKRVSNILSKYTENLVAETINSSLFEHESEKVLYEALIAKREYVMSQKGQYTEILKTLASLREPVDTFFDKVLVMTENKAQRENRLLLLKQLRELFLHVADVALI